MKKSYKKETCIFLALLTYSLLASAYTPFVLGDLYMAMRPYNLEGWVSSDRLREGDLIAVESEGDSYTTWRVMHLTGNLDNNGFWKSWYVNADWYWVANYHGNQCNDIKNPYHFKYLGNTYLEPDPPEPHESVKSSLKMLGKLKI